MWVLAGSGQPAPPEEDTGYRDLSEELHSNSSDPQVSLSPQRLPFHICAETSRCSCLQLEGEGEAMHGFSGSTKLKTITAIMKVRREMDG